MGLKVSKGVSRYLVDIWDNIWFIVFAQKQGCVLGFGVLRCFCFGAKFGVLLCEVLGPT
jgi:hypothetical protein